MWKVYKHILLDLARNRTAIGYGLLLFLVSTGLFMVEADNTKALITLAQVMLAIVPLLALCFTIIYHYDQYEFTVLLAVQPLRRRTILSAQYMAVTTALVVPYLIGVGLPVLVWAPGAVGWTIVLTGVLLTAVFAAIGEAIAVLQREKARAVGLGLVTWVLLVLVYDAMLLWLMYSMSDRPIEPFVVPLAAFNPIDLARMLIMLKVDLAALLGYTGAVYEQFFGSTGGMVVACLALFAWAAMPMWGATVRFGKKDL